MNKIYYVTNEGVGLEFLNERVEKYLGEKWIGKVNSSSILNQIFAKVLQNNKRPCVFKPAIKCRHCTRSRIKKVLEQIIAINWRQIK